MSTLPSFEGPNATTEPTIDHLEDVYAASRVSTLASFVVDSVRYAGYRAEFALNPNPNLMPVSFDRFRAQRQEA